MNQKKCNVCRTETYQLSKDKTVINKTGSMTTFYICRDCRNKRRMAEREKLLPHCVVCGVKLKRPSLMYCSPEHQKTANGYVPSVKT